MSKEIFFPPDSVEARLDAVSEYLEAIRNYRIDRVRELTPLLSKAYRGVPDAFVYREDKISSLTEKLKGKGKIGVRQGLLLVRYLRDLHLLPLHLATSYEGYQTDARISREEVLEVGKKVVESLDQCGGEGKGFVRSRLEFLYDQLKFEGNNFAAERVNNLSGDLRLIPRPLYLFRRARLRARLDRPVRAH
ncbi:hypothetical protein HYT33_02390 [Candidatus Roizmanbacteria bacterium]|nr:hypothetical protein [Candidatus Roizmanbacteria bacterium]